MSASTGPPKNGSKWVETKAFSVSCPVSLGQSSGRHSCHVMRPRPSCDRHTMRKCNGNFGFLQFEPPRNRNGRFVAKAIANPGSALRQAGPVRVSCHVVKCRHPPNFPFNLNCRHMLANSNHRAKFRFVCAIQSQAVKLVFPRPCSLELRGRNSFSGFLAPAPVGGGISAFEQSQRAWRHR